MSGSYDWTKDGEDITEETSGIDSTTVHSHTLDISSMNELLVGIYECRLNLNGQLRNTFDVKIVGLARYNICQNDPDDCSENITYGSTSTETFILNATITFFHSGIDCCRENLLDPVWEVIVPPGNTNNGQEIRVNGVYPPGIHITTETGNDLTTNIASITIRNASVPFQITHLMHTNVDDNDVGGGQISITFNFNYTEGTATTTMTPSVNSPTPSATSTMSSMSPNMTSSSTSQTSTTTSTAGSSFNTTELPNPTTTDVSDIPTIATTPSNAGTRVMDEDDDSNIGVIIGVVVSIVIIFIAGAAVVVAVFLWYHHNKDPTLGEQSEIQSDGANGSAHRPTTIPLSSQTPLLNLTGPCAYTNTATPQQIAGAPMPYGNASNGVNGDLHHQNADDPEDDPPVDDSCFDNDSPSVEI